MVHIVASPFCTLALVTEGSKLPDPGCPKKCGTVDIPYPFGIGTNCSLDEGFVLSCKESDGKMVPFFSDLEVYNITLSRAEAIMYNQISWQCYNESDDSSYSKTWYLDLSSTVYTLSSLHNSYTAIGCQTLAINDMMGYKRDHYRAGCVSTCYSYGSLTNGSCSGNGCCQTSIPSGIDYYKISFNKDYNNSQVWDFSRYSYAAIMATDSFNFSTSYISTYDFWYAHNGTVPVVLDWSVGTEKCEVAQANRSSYACVSNNSTCINSKNGPGYFCNCSTGYQGNPYVPDGCQDINECDDNSTCSGICKNIDGSFECTCPPGTEGNATRGGKCSEVHQRQREAHSQSLPRWANIAIGVSIGFVLLLFCFLLMHIVREKRKLTSIREKYFQQYGGRVLLEEMKSNHGIAFIIFTQEELKEATNNFHEINMLGQGGNGAIYKGTLKNNEDAAIKKCKTVNERNKKEFGKEMLILSQINHKNIVRVLGCCLEVEIPILVYEFIPNGTLFDLIHSASRISLSIRLKLAQEAAEALAYLHSWASPPIVHCDVKSANILLDENYVAKVSDFGASAVAPSDEDQFLTLVQGTRGYLDPQCTQTGQLTVKSDVYSFGVVLLELLTRKKPFYLDGPEERSLSLSFLTSMKENKLDQIFDEQIVSEENMHLIVGVAELARECLNMEGEKRPEMREVAEQLNKLRKGMKHPWGQENCDEIESLNAESSSNLELEVTSYRSLEKKAMLVMEAGR